MRYFKEFSGMTEYNNEKNSLSIPNLCYIIEDDVVIYSTKSISDAVISCDDSTYDGEHHIATNIVVTISGVTLTNNIDYIISDNNGGINAGNYYFTITGINNYCGNIIGKYAINKVAPILSAPTPKVLTYNGQAQELIVAGSTNYGTLKYSMDDATWGTSIPTATNYGNYTVWYRVEGNSNVNNVSENSVVCSINASQSSFTVILSQTAYTYNGSACEPTVTVKDGDVVIPSSQYSVAYNNNINAGTATVTVRDNNGSIIGSETFTINKANGSISTIPTAITGITYNGLAQILSNPGVGTGTMLYKIDSNTWSGSMPSATNAGTYTVYYKASASTNYNESTSGSMTCSIAKVTPTVTAPTTDVLVYNGSSQVLANAGSTNWGTLQYCLNNSGGTYSTTVPSATNAGTYNLWYKVIGDSNINDVVPASISVSILSKYITSPTIELDPSGYTYNGSACVPTVVVKDGTTVIPSSEYTITYEDNTNAGNASVNISDNSGGNYDVNGEKSFVISKGNGSVSTAPTAKSITYNGNSQALVNSGSSSTGVMMYKLGNNAWTEIIPTASNAGTYTVYYKAAASTNYNESASGSVSCSIAKADCSYIAPTAKSNLTYDGTNKDLINLGSTSDGLIEYSTDNTNWTTLSPQAANAGTYSVYWRITGDNNHNDKASTAINVTIAKAAGIVSTAPTAKSLTYNGSAQALINAGSGTGTMLYKEGSNSWGSTIPSATTAGTYTVYYKASASTNYNESASGSVSVTLAKVTPTVTAPTAKSLTYNGSSQALVNTGSTNWGTLKYSLDNSSYSTSVPSGTNASSYTVYYRVDGDSNINNVAAQTVSATISKAAGSVTTAPTAKSLTYNGSSQALVNEGSGTGTMLYKLDGLDWGNGVPSANAAGTYTVYYKASASTNYNESASGSVSVTINKVTPTVTAPTAKSLIYNGLYQALANAGSTNYGTLQYSEDNTNWITSMPTEMNAGNYTVYYRVVGDSNINDVASQSISTSISRASRTISFTTAPTSLIIGNSATVAAEISAGSGDGSITYSSSNSSIASVNGNVITGVDNGTCSIIATVSQGTNYISASTSYTLTVEGYTYVDLGLPSGTRWAKSNMGSSSQEGVGEYFSWGNIVGHTRDEGYNFSVSNYASTSGYNASGDIIPVSDYDAPRNVWGAPWRLPTKDEVDELIANTNKENITISGRNCWKFINKNDSSKYIIFPRVGYYNGTTLNRDNERVFMWSNNNNSTETPDEAYTLFLGNSSCIAQNINRYIGNTIRPVQDDGTTEEFIFFSDPHVFTAYTEVVWTRDIHLEVMQKYFNLTSSNFIICGGDWLWAHTLQVAIDDLEMANQRMMELFGNKYYPVLGNHDLNDEGDAEIPSSTLTNILFSRWNSHYYTFNGRNTIFYVFDTGSSLNTAMNSYRYEQVKWFCSGLVNNTNSHIVIVMHMAQTGTEDDAPITCPMAQYLSAAANAFNNRSSYTVDGSSYNFSSCVGRVHIILAGHWHQDNNYVYNNIPIYIIDDARTGNFDIMFFDYANNQLRSKRIGTGNDRTITLA